MAEPTTARSAYEAAVQTAASVAGTPIASYSTDQSIATLATYSRWTSSNASAFPTVTYSFPVVDNSSSTPDEPADYIGNSRYGTLRSFSPEQAAAARLSMALWDDLVALKFVDVGTNPNADTRFFNSTLINTAGGAPAGLGIAGDIWIYNYDSDPPATRDWSVGAFYFGYWMLHEIGHTLGLSHAGSYPGSGYGGLNYLQDSAVYTLMSYNSETDTGLDWSMDMATPMVNDVAAVQYYYGADMTTRTGNTVYGFNSNIADRLPLNFASMIAQEGGVAPITIWDAGGIDTLDLSGFGASADIDLNAGGYTNANGQKMLIGIAYGATIENAVGGRGSDIVHGNAVANDIRGGAGQDALYGRDGDNILVGGIGNDTLEGGQGNDSLSGGGGSSEFSPLRGISLNQGATDQYLVAAGYSGISGASNAGVFTIEMLVSGISGYNELLSYANNQTANAFGVGLANNGKIELTYRGVKDATTVDASRLADGGTHRFSLTWNNKQYAIYIDGVQLGSGTHSSTSTSLNGSGTLVIGQEQDTIGGGFQSSQILRGSVGDIRIFSDIRTAAEISANAFTALADPVGEQGLVSNWRVDANSIAAGSLTDARGGSSLGLAGSTASIDLVGGWDNDSLDGGAGQDTLDGGTGADTVTGGDGNDLIYLDNADQVSGGAGSDFATAYASAAAVTIDAGAGSIEGVYGSAFGDRIDAITLGSAGQFYGYDGNDTIIGSAFDDYLHGGNGADSLDSGGGNDTIEFDYRDVIAGGAGIDFATAFYSSERIGITTHLVGIEGVYGSAFDDVVNAAGQSASGTFYGYNGNDAIYGSGLSDFISGGAGADTLDGGGGNDTIEFDNQDVIGGGAGIDFVSAFYSPGRVGITTHLVGVEGVYGSAFNDVVNAAGQNVGGNFYGYNGNDAIYGSGYDDFINGGAGADTLAGGGGNDTIEFDYLDTISGGAGSDFASAFYSEAGININTAATGLEGVYGTRFNDIIDARSQSAAGNFYG